jgi:1-acyl-sn-glycerol-3-phosphate acyltransferase
LNCIKLDRKGIGKEALREGLKDLNRGKGLLVFPEGTRSIDGSLGSGKAGVAAFAMSVGVPVIPTFITGTEQAMPPGVHYIRFRKVSISFGKKLIPPKVINKADRKSAYQGFIDKVMQEIGSLEKKEKTY